MHRSARHARQRGRGPLGKAAGIFGELFLTAGVLVLLYVAHVLWGTGIQTERAQGDLREQIETTWGAGDEPEAAETQELDLGDAFGLLRIPRLGDDSEWVVVNDVDLGNLARGPGHYPDSAVPGELGSGVLTSGQEV
jgi:sortase A